MRDFDKLITKIFNKTKNITSGENAQYIPELAKVDPSIYAISICDINGNIYHKGDYKSKIAIESISKLFTMSLAVQKHGINAIIDKIGMHGSFLPFNSIVAAGLSSTHTINPFLNQGAIATTSLLYDKDEKTFKKKLLQNMSDFASNKLAVDKHIYDSESETNSTNLSLSYFLKNKKRLYAPVIPTVDAYTYQCSVKVTSDDLARMASVFANEGKIPKTQKRIISKQNTEYILNSVLSEGLYEYSNEWIVKTGGGAYAKSGVGGGLIIIIPGVCGIGIVSPKLDKYGNSKRGMSAAIKLSRILNRDFFQIKTKKTRKTMKSKKTRKTRKTKKQ